MKSLITISFLSFILFAPTAFAQWVDVSSGLPNWGWASAIDACDANNSVICVRPPLPNRKQIFKTTNGGNGWRELLWPENEPNEEPMDICMIDSDHIWFGTGDGRIYHTSDGGTTWIQQLYVPVLTTFINYIEMFDLNNGIAMGDPASFSTNDPAVILKTTNGGTTWTQTNHSNVISVSGDLWRRLDFIDLQNGFFFESMYPHTPSLYKTTNMGYNWQQVCQINHIQILKFYNKYLGIAGLRNASGSFIITRTVDGGSTWVNTSTIYTGWGNDIEFVPGNPDLVWFVGYESVFLSRNRGATWEPYSLTEGHLKGRDMVFTDASNGWLLCDDGKVYRTTNNGGGNPVIITDVEEKIIPSDFQLNQNYPNPFNPETVISFQLTDNGHAVFKVFDILGNEVATLVDEQKQAGVHQVVFDGTGLSSGVYLYTLQAGKFSDTKKFVLMK